MICRVTTSARGRLDAARRLAVERSILHLGRPYWVRSPRRLLHRLTGDLTVPHTRVPWGLEVTFDPASVVGMQLARTGIHDLVLSEALFRITDPGDVCVDAGANIGYTASIMATRAGPGGRVVAFEPAPDTFSLLEGNIAAWQNAGIAPIEARQLALSSVAGEATLVTPPAYGADTGGRTLEVVDTAIDATPVRCSTLDGEGLARIDVLKIDVEGHELALLDGSAELLGPQAIRDILFEEHESPPTPVSERLTAAGYTVFRLGQGLTGPMLQADIEQEFPIYRDAPNYLATVDPQRAAIRLGSRGWRCLRQPR
jgi:FkbM family methyltransferase